jgi:hypothetical protein
MTGLFDFVYFNDYKNVHFLYFNIHPITKVVDLLTPAPQCTNTLADLIPS